MRSVRGFLILREITNIISKVVVVLISIKVKSVEMNIIARKVYEDIEENNVEMMYVV